MKKSLFTTTILFLLFAANSLAQHPAMKNKKNMGRIGLSTSLGDDLANVNIPFWLTNSFMIAPTFGYSYIQKKELDFNAGLSTRHYIMTSDISWYFGFRVGSFLLIPYIADEFGEKTRRTDLFAGANFGLEYFFAENLSFGLEMQGDYIKSDERSQRFENTGGMGIVMRPVFVITFYFY